MKTWRIGKTKEGFAVAREGGGVEVARSLDDAAQIAVRMMDIAFEKRRHCETMDIDPYARSTDAMVNEINLGLELREIRIEQDLSLNAVCVNADCNMATLSKAERGRAGMSVQMLCRVAGVLGYEVRLARKEEAP